MSARADPQRSGALGEASRARRHAARPSAARHHRSAKERSAGRRARRQPERAARRRARRIGSCCATVGPGRLRAHVGLHRQFQGGRAHARQPARIDGGQERQAAARRRGRHAQLDLVRSRRRAARSPPAAALRGCRAAPCRIRGDPDRSAALPAAHQPLSRHDDLLAELPVRATERRARSDGRRGARGVAPLGGSLVAAARRVGRRGDRRRDRAALPRSSRALRPRARRAVARVRDDRDVRRLRVFARISVRRCGPRVCVARPAGGRAADAHRGRPQQRAAGRRSGRVPGARSDDLPVLLQQRRGDARGVHERRLVPHGRSRAHRARPAVARRPQQGQHHRQRRQLLQPRAGDDARSARRHQALVRRGVPDAQHRRRIRAARRDVHAVVPARRR